MFFVSSLLLRWIFLPALISTTFRRAIQCFCWLESDWICISQWLSNQYSMLLLVWISWLLVLLYLSNINNNSLEKSKKQTCTFWALNIFTYFKGAKAHVFFLQKVNVCLTCILIATLFAPAAQCRLISSWWQSLVVCFLHVHQPFTDTLTALFSGYWHKRKEIKMACRWK